MPLNHQRCSTPLFTTWRSVYSKVRATTHQHTVCKEAHNHVLKQPLLIALRNCFLTSLSVTHSLAVQFSLIQHITTFTYRVRVITHRRITLEAAHNYMLCQSLPVALQNPAMQCRDAFQDSPSWKNLDVFLPKADSVSGTAVSTLLGKRMCR